MDDGGYGIPLSLSPQARRAKAAALLHNSNFTYAGGVSRFLSVPIIRCSPLLFKENRLPGAVKYSHRSIRQLSWRMNDADFNPLVHPDKLPKQNVALYYSIPSLSNEFSTLGAATAVSLVCLPKF